MTQRSECPTLSISNSKVYFNAQCMRKFWDVPYIQLLLHPFERKLAIRPCHEHSAHSIRWRPDASKAVVCKTISCQHFGRALFEIMQWNPDFVYRIRGTWVARGVDQIIVFNLVNALPAAIMDTSEAKSKTRRVDLCPEEWNDSFGEEFYEHSLQNSFFFLAPHGDWKAQVPSREVCGFEQTPILTETEIAESALNLRKRVGS